MTPRGTRDTRAAQELRRQVDLAAVVYDRARCREPDVDGTIFFLSNANRKTQQKALADARAVCAQCPVQIECLEFVMATELPHARTGIWSGTTPNERRRLRRERLQEAS